MNDEDWKKVAERHLGKHIEYVNGWADCEERIIALLESHTHETEAESRFCDLCERYYGVGLALALIKGETK